MGAFIRLLLRGGLSTEEYDAIQSDVVQTNLRNLRLYSPIACAVFSILATVSMLMQQGPPTSNQSIYLIAAVAMAAIIPCAHLLDRAGATAHPRLVGTLTQVFILVLHAFSIALSITHPEFPAVTAIVFLLVNPLLFVGRPVHAAAMTALATAAICVSSALTKDAYLAMDDIWNALTFALVALAVDVLNMRMRIVQLFQTREIAYLSKTDTLTQLRNRNNYESRLEDYPRSGAATIICAYADANGLRELNNTRGHDAGDQLLYAIAQQMRTYFGANDTYRIGGDEFVAFALDGSVEEVWRMLGRMQDELSDKGFSVSCGVAETEAPHANMHALVRAAEKEMYTQKQAYHQSQAGSNEQ